MKFKAALAELAHANRQQNLATNMFRREWTIVHPDPNSEDFNLREGVKLAMSWGSFYPGNPDTNIEAEVTLGFHVISGHADMQIGWLHSSAIKRIAEIKARVELWESGFRDELPTQAEVDEL